MKNIRNFSIIAHIDHGKSTLADRLLEATGTVEKRKMREQVLDSMDLERERGITIKMQPVRMDYASHSTNYVLNLIDTPGHIDFSYEVSRALKAVEGSLLLVDATQGVQAQTLTTLNAARDLGLVLIPVVTKIDSPLARKKEVKEEIAALLDVSTEEVLEVSGKTGEGVEKLLEEIVRRIPPPKQEFPDTKSVRALVFDFEYSTHKGIILYVRVFDGGIRSGQDLIFQGLEKKLVSGEVGFFAPEAKKSESLESGEIGYVVTGIKEPGVASVGDTITSPREKLPVLLGYEVPKPVVWASIFPESQDDFTALFQALERLRLSDSSLSFEEESSGVLGRGFRCGFLGMLHMEIIVERLRREFDLELVVTTPSISYEVLTSAGEKKIIYSPVHFPEYGDISKIWEPWVNARVISPNEYLGNVLTLAYEHEAEVGETETFGDGRSAISLKVPLRELMRGFFDELKSVSSGYASLSYEMGDMREADVVRLDILVADELVPAFTRVVSKKRVGEEAITIVERLYEHLPRQLFVAKIQAKAMGRILASKTLSALKKDVTAHMYGGDITRKMKLREKQKKGKKKMKARGSMNIPHDTFLKIMKGN
jgi:GTP-binding protein LepA